MPKSLFLFLIILVVATSACNTGASTPPSVQPATSLHATATPGSFTLEPLPTLVSSPIVEVTATAQRSVSVPVGLQVVYVSDGNLWSWTEAGGNVLLTGTGEMSTASLFSDGQLLGFMRGGEVWTIHMDGSNARPLVVQEQVGGRLFFSPDGLFLAVSTNDHIDLIDLANVSTSTVLTYPALPNGYFPQIVWSAEGTGFKTVIPAMSETEQAEFLFIMSNGIKARLARFSMVPPKESAPFISPDGGYLIYVAPSSNGKESLYLMDSSGAARPYAEEATSVRALGWLPDSKHFAYVLEEQEGIRIGEVGTDTSVETGLTSFKPFRWLDMDRFLGIQDGVLFIGKVDGERRIIAEGVTDFDFAK